MFACHASSCPATENVGATVGALIPQFSTDEPRLTQTVFPSSVSPPVKLLPAAGTVVSHVGTLDPVSAMTGVVPA